MERVSERAVVLPGGEHITVTVTRKKMKTCRLKVSRCGEVTMSVPLKTPEDWILRFLQERSSWLAERLAECAQLPPTPGMDAVTDGGRVQFLGKIITVCWKSALKKGGVLAGDTLTICGKDPEKLQAYFDNWWKGQAETVFTQTLLRLYPLVCQPEKPFPTLKTRRMKSRWGSCHTQKRAICLNLYLLQASQDCVDYVALHELGHLLYPNHGPQFHAFLDRCMPNWKERKRRLTQSVVL